MERTYRLDLSLFPSNTMSPSSDVISDQNFSGDEPPAVNRQGMTISYDGRIRSFDVTELQARAIILLASQGAEGRASNNKTRLFEAAIPDRTGSQLYSLNGLSMKKSLQRFLQERKRRIKASLSPDNR